MWNYRIAVKKHGTDEDYGIYEAYYAEDGHVGLISEDAMSPFGETPEELKDDFEAMKQAFDMPILDWETLKEIK